MIAFLLTAGVPAAEAGKVVFEKTVLGKPYKIETIDGEPKNYTVTWGDEQLKWEPKPWYDDELNEKGPLLYTEWLQPLYYPYTIPLEEREKFDGFDVANSGYFLGPFTAPTTMEDQFMGRLYSPGAGYKRDKTGFEWNAWYETSKRVPKWRWDPEPLPEQEGQPYRKYVFLFRSPRDLQKVGFLQIQFHGRKKEDENFLYVPTVRKVRRLATANRQDVAGGLVLRQEQNAIMTPIHNYKMLRTQLCNMGPDKLGYGGGEPEHPDVAFKRVDGVGEPCWVYEVTPFREDWWFARQEQYVGMFTFGGWYTESFDAKGRMIQSGFWGQQLSPAGGASKDGVPNCCGRKTHLAWGGGLFKDFTTGFWVIFYPSDRTLNPPIPDSFYNVQTLLQEPKTIDFYR